MIFVNIQTSLAWGLGAGGVTVSNHSGGTGVDLLVLSEVFSVCGAAQLKLMIGRATSLLLISLSWSPGDKHMRARAPPSRASLRSAAEQRRLTSLVAELH